MDYSEATARIRQFDALRERVLELVRENPEVMGEDAWLVNALTVGDMTLDATSDGVRVFGLAWTSLTQDAESFDFTVPYDLF